jgi:hypothetical protein
MKRALPIAVALLVTLLMAQPALAGLSCTMQMAPGVPCAPACDMAISQMSANCPMHHRAPQGICFQDCCRPNTLPAVVQAVSKFRPRVLAATLQILPPPLSTETPAKALAAHSLIDLGASPPPRYILFRVFRI